MTQNTKKESPFTSALEKLVTDYGSSMEEASLIPHGVNCSMLAYSAMLNPVRYSDNVYQIKTTQETEKMLQNQFSRFVYRQDPTLRSVISVHECTKKEKEKAVYIGKSPVYQLTMLLYLKTQYHTQAQQKLSALAEHKENIKIEWFGFD